MSAGTMFGPSCFASQRDAATAFCAAQSGVTSAGIVSCAGISQDVSTIVGGDTTFAWSMRLIASDGSSTTRLVEGQFLPGCETYDMDYWTPVISAFVVAMALILAGRLVVRRTLMHDAL